MLVSILFALCLCSKLSYTSPVEPLSSSGPHLQQRDLHHSIPLPARLLHHKRATGNRATTLHTDMVIGDIGGVYGDGGGSVPKRRSAKRAVHTDMIIGDSGGFYGDGGDGRNSRQAKRAVHTDMIIGDDGNRYGDGGDGRNKAKRAVHTDMIIGDEGNRYGDGGDGRNSRQAKRSVPKIGEGDDGETDGRQTPVINRMK